MTPKWVSDASAEVVETKETRGCEIGRKVRKSDGGRTAREEFCGWFEHGFQMREVVIRGVLLTTTQMINVREERIYGTEERWG